MTTSQSGSPAIHRAVFAYILGMLLFCYAFVQRVAPSVVTEELMRDFTVGAASLGILSGAYFYTYAAIQLPVGLLTDRFGPRKLMSIAALVCGVASVGFANSENLLAASFFRAIIGGAVAFGFVGTLSIIAQFFSPARFAMLAGIVQSMGMIGAIAGQAPLRVLVEKSGWQGTFMWLAVTGLVLGALLYIVVPRRSKVEQTTHRALSVSLSEVAGQPQSWLCAIIGFGLAAPMLSFAGLWGIPWLEVTYGYDKKQAAGLVSILFVGWAISSPIAGWLSDRAARRKPVMIAGSLLSLCGFVLLIYGAVWSTTMLAVLLALTGIGGAVMVVVFGSVRESNRPANNAAAMGFANMFVVGSGAIMQPLLGWLLEKNWDGVLRDEVPYYSAETYSHAMIALVASLIAALMATLALKETYGKNQFQ